MRPSTPSVSASSADAKPPCVRAQVAQQELGRLQGDATGEGLARGPVEVRVDAQQLGVVVEHLLEVGDHPAGVHGIPREAAAELVVHSAPGHRRARPRSHGEGVVRPGARVVAKEELQHHRRRELRCAAESRCAVVELATQRVDGCVEDVGVEGVPAHRCGEPTQRLGDVRAALQDAVALVGPRTRHPRQQLQELALREVRPGEEGVAVGSEETGHRPAAVTGQGGRGSHVDRVDVGSFLTVHLDRDEAGVDHLSHAVVLERLVGHDVAPVARGIPDREQDRHVTASRLREGVGSPLLPVDGVVLVLQQVWGGRVGETVGHASHSSSPVDETANASPGAWTLGGPRWWIYSSPRSGGTTFIAAMPVARG